MPKTHFPTGQGSGYEWASLLSQYLPNAPVGNVYFVGSTVTAASDTAGFGYSPEAPFATLKYALGSTGPTTANQGDVVACLPGHTEAVIAAATIGTNKAGISVVGLGTGRLRPVITYTTAAAASFDITAANTFVSNLVFSAIGVAAVTAALNITAADVWIFNCEFNLADATNQAALGILTNASATRLRIEDCDFHGTANAGTAAAIRLVGGSDIRIRRNFIRGSYTTTKGGIDNITTAVTNILIDGNTIINDTALSTVAINLAAGTTGAVVNNRMGILSGTAPIVGAGIDTVGGNYFKGAVGVAAGTLI